MFARCFSSSSILLILFAALFAGCNATDLTNGNENKDHEKGYIYLEVLGVIQDAGYPQANCHKSCCKNLWNQEVPRKYVSCLGLIDHSRGEYYIFDATPDFKYQMEMVQQSLKAEGQLPAGIFLTHAHIGHYTGLMHLGREAIGSNMVPVYAMPGMYQYLSSNGPWSQLVTLKNIDLHLMKADSMIRINEEIAILPYQVPHRDEYSETVGFSIRCNGKSILFIPDIDKWGKWERNIVDEVKAHDISYLDGSFYANGEIPNRDMSEIPHPFLTESMEVFQSLTREEKSRIHFIHFNHTNPVINNQSEAYHDIVSKGFNIATEGERIILK